LISSNAVYEPLLCIFKAAALFAPGGLAGLEPTTPPALPAAI